MDRSRPVPSWWGWPIRAGRIDMCAAVLWMLLGSHGVMAVEDITESLITGGVDGGGL